MNKLPKFEIEFIVNRLHVGTTDEQIARDIRHRLRRNPWTQTPAGQRFEDKCVRYALKCHHDNQHLYRVVTSGNFN